MKEVYFTTRNGTLVAEVEGEKYWETVDVAAKFGFGETVEVDDFSDAWELVDMLETLLETAKGNF